jgi:hypothetical protein
LSGGFFYKRLSGPVSRVLYPIIYDRQRPFNLTGRYRPAPSISRQATYPLISPGPSNGIQKDPNQHIWPCRRWGLPCRRRHRRRGALLPHHFTFTPAFSRESKSGGCVVSAALSRGSPRVAVSHHRALSCSDFPPLPFCFAYRSNRGDRPAHSINYHRALQYYTIITMKCRKKSTANRPVNYHFF